MSLYITVHYASNCFRYHFKMPAFKNSYSEGWSACNLQIFENLKEGFTYWFEYHWWTKYIVHSPLAFYLNLYLTGFRSERNPVGSISVRYRFNLYHSLGIFSRRQIDDILLIFPRKQDLTFHPNCLLRRPFAWNVKSCFLFSLGDNFYDLTFHPIVSLGDNLHEISNPVFWEK